MPWMHDRKPGKDAPRDGRMFDAVAKGSVEVERFCWDDDMNCFLSTSYALVDELACWWDDATRRARMGEPWFAEAA